MLGTALLAYSFGLRHAVDADHIAAIDNVTRKLMQEGKRPISVGFWFSIGHSAVVVLVALAIAVTTTELAGTFDVMEGRGRHRQHLRIDAVPVRRRGDEHRHPDRRLEDLPPRPARRFAMSNKISTCC